MATEGAHETPASTGLTHPDLQGYQDEQRHGANEGEQPHLNSTPGWMSHIPNLQYQQFPHAPASFLYSADSSSHFDQATIHDFAPSPHLLDHHPAYAPPPTSDTVQQGQPIASDFLRSSTDNGSGFDALDPELFTTHEIQASHVIESDINSASVTSQLGANGDPDDISPWNWAFHRLNDTSKPPSSSSEPHASHSAALQASGGSVYPFGSRHGPIANRDGMHIAHRGVEQDQQQRRTDGFGNLASGDYYPLANNHGSDRDDDDDDVEETEPGFTLPSPSKRVYRKRMRQDMLGEQVDETDEGASNKRQKGERRRGRRKGEVRGPKAAVEPDENFLRVYNDAMDAFIEQRQIDKAQRLILQAIGMNPEVFAAHSLLADVHFARGNYDAGIDALMVGLHAHLNDVELWRHTADRILNVPHESYRKRVERAMYCYGAILRKDAKDLDARFQRAECARILRSWNRAFADLDILLQEAPHNSDILAQFAKLCQDVNDASKARKVYEDHFQYFLDSGVSEESRYTWQDVGIYIDLLITGNETALAIVMLKRLARALSGRQDEEFWESIIVDDREFDQNHYPRRLEVTEFEPNKHPDQFYGESLPLDLRAKLGVLRLKLGFRDEAQSHFDWLEPDLEGEESLVEEYSDSFYEIAKALHDAKEHEQALHFYTALKNEDIDLGIEFWHDMGASCYVCNQKELAIQCYERSLQLQPNNIEALTQLTKLHRDLKHRQQAITYGNQAVVLAQAMIPTTMNRKYERKENRLMREAAENELKKAFRLPKGPGKARGKVPRDLIYRSRTKRAFVRYIPPSTEEPQDSTIANGGEVSGSYPPQGENGEHGLFGEQQKSSKRSTRPAKTKITKSKKPNQESTSKHYEDVQTLYQTLLKHQTAMRENDEVATNIWMDCAATMVDDFRTVKAFYPAERHIMFLGYTAANPQPKPADVDNEATEIQRDSGHVTPAGNVVPPVNDQAEFVDVAQAPRRLAVGGAPDEYCGIQFMTWLDIFLELAILYATASPAAENQNDCYAVINAALDCTIFYHDIQVVTTIYTCYLACALALGDDLTLYNVVLRWFMREYAFCTDTYRLYMAVNMLNELPVGNGGRSGQMEKAIFKSGPNQKFIFRQLMSIDKLLPTEYNKDGPEGGVPTFMRKHRDELRKLSKTVKAINRKSTGRQGEAEGDEPPVPAVPDQEYTDGGLAKAYTPVEMDVVLFILYAHIMMASGSFPNSLSYLYRAYSLDPTNAVCLLSMAFCYLHELFKRQTGNRHSYALMGWAWFGKYEEARLKWAETVDERANQAEPDRTEADSRTQMVDVIKQEIEYNRARCFEMLGMADLGIRGYEKILNTSRIDGRGEEDQQVAQEEEWSKEAAYAMSTIYALNGNGAKAREITEQYLVV